MMRNSPLVARHDQLAITLTQRLEVLLRYLLWACRIEPAGPGLVPGRSRRVLVHREDGTFFWKAHSFVVDAVPRAVLAEHWPLARGRAVQAREEAWADGQSYFILTDRSLTETVAANMSRLAAHQHWRFNDDVIEALLGELTPGQPMTLGVLVARVARRGFPRHQIEGDALRLLAFRTLIADLSQPLGPGALVLRPRHPCCYSIERSDAGSGAPVRRIPPPWIGCDQWR